MWKEIIRKKSHLERKKRQKKKYPNMSMVCMCKSNKKSTWKKQRGEKFCTTACTTRENKLIVRKSGEWITRGKKFICRKNKTTRATRERSKCKRNKSWQCVKKKNTLRIKKINVKLYGSWENHVLKFFFLSQALHVKNWQMNHEHKLIVRKTKNTCCRGEKR